MTDAALAEHLGSQLTEVGEATLIKEYDERSALWAYTKALLAFRLARR